MLTKLQTILLAAAASAFVAVPAYSAPRDRVFVASYGTDTGNTICSFTQPCRTFANAILNVAVGGEITAIDSAGFGPVTITQSVTITSPNGVEAGIVAVAGGAAITVNGSAITVALRGLTLEGSGSGGYGVYVQQGSQLEIENCVVRDFTTAGIYLVSSTTTYLTLNHSIIASNPLGVFLTTPVNPLIVAMDNDVFDMNSGAIQDQPSAASIFMTVANSSFSHNIHSIFTGGTGPSAVANARLYNLVFTNGQDIMNIQNYSNIALSHIYDMSSGNGLAFNGATGVSVISDDTNHVTLSGPDNPGGFGAYSFK
jgi:Right handed beta helix region